MDTDPPPDRQVFDTDPDPIITTYVENLCWNFRIIYKG